MAQGPAQSEEEKTPIPIPEVTVTAPYRQPAVPDRATTGAKTDTPLKDIPASIQVVPKELLSEQGAYRIDAIIKDVSGIAVVRQGGQIVGDSYLIRGLRANFLRNGLPDSGATVGYGRTLTDVERVEVLKGPGSALYGNGDPGGTINLITKQPLETPLYSLYGSGGSFGTHLEAVDLGGPLGTTRLLYRFNGAYYHTDGFRDQANTTVEILPKLAWKPDVDHTLTLDFDYRSIKIVPDSYGIQFRGRDLLDVPRDTKYFTPFNHVDQDVFRVALRYEGRLTDALAVRTNLSVLTREVLVLRNAGGSVGPGSIAQTGRTLRKQTEDTNDAYLFQLEPVWTVKPGTTQHTLLSGFEFQHQFGVFTRADAALPSIVNVFHPVIPEQSTKGLEFVKAFDGTQESDKFGLYVQDQIEFSEEWKARVGARISRFDTTSFNRQSQPRTVSRSDDALDGQAGLVYQPVKATSFYVGFSRSHSQPNINSEQSNVAVVPESATQWELGNKTTFLDDRISLNLAVFHVTRENFLVTIASEQVPIGEQRTQGFELDLASEPVRGWKLYANYAYQDAELVRLAPTDTSAGKGHRPTLTPEQSAGLWTTYELQSGPLRGLGFGGGITFKGTVFADNENTRRIPGYVVGDLVAFYRLAPFEVQVNVKNVADTTYFTSGVNGGASVGDPLSVLATARVRY
jgi:iron complex outermembrane receptor protein